MSIQIFNTQTRTKEEFKPVHDGKVNMYVCGPTVYDLLHVGNFRGAVFFNMVRNWFERSGYEVTYVYNYTDVEDKILKRAQDEGVEPKVISERYIEEFKKDYGSLQLRPHTHNPKVTEFIPQIVTFIEKLIENGKAYEAEGDVYFDVKSIDDYGKLSNKNVDDLEAGFRVEVIEAKKSSADFALWKSAKDGEQSWESPWGAGRPGWHIECSVMSHTILGDTLDIHGGGLDLVFPHHENEIAQSEGCTGHKYVNYWMHNNMLQFGSKKMSKSVGNIRTARSFIEQYDGEILKYMLLHAHYRSLIDFSDEQISRAIQSLAKFYSALSFAKKLLAREADLVPIPENFQKQMENTKIGFAEAMNDDFNSAEALARMFELTRQFNSFVRKPKFMPEHKAVAEGYFYLMKDLGEVMAFFQQEPEQYLIALDDMLLEQKDLKRADIQAIVDDRTQARADKDYQKSDELRDKLAEMGISLQDTIDAGTLWEVAK